MPPTGEELWVHWVDPSLLERKLRCIVLSVWFVIENAASWFTKGVFKYVAYFSLTCYYDEMNDTIDL